MLPFVDYKQIFEGHIKTGGDFELRKIVECVPNFSEGRRKAVVEGIANEIRKISGVKILDYSMDRDHNRSVITFIGSPEGVKEAAFKAAEKASLLIDLREHEGEHPRVGATDVIPFVPLMGVSMEECVIIARETAKKIADVLSIPTFLYEEAASVPERRNLAHIRRGEFEGMKYKIMEEGWAPDFGPRRVHPTAGATVVGARMPLIAFNVNLGTDDIEIADRIAKTIRESSGGLKSVKAIGVMLKEKNTAQVSMNMVNYKETGLYEVFEMIKREAEKYGVDVIESELIGLMPLEALTDTVKQCLKLNDFSKGRVIENFLYE